MNYETKSQKIFCPAIAELENTINRYSIKSAPKSVYIQIGTNDLESDVTYNTIKKSLHSFLAKLKKAFDNPEIILSSIIVRKDLEERVDHVNEIFLKLAKGNNQVRFMKNSNIKMRMLKDKKHVDKIGFSILLANIRPCENWISAVN